MVLLVASLDKSDKVERQASKAGAENVTQGKGYGFLRPDGGKPAELERATLVGNQALL